MLTKQNQCYRIDKNSVLKYRTRLWFQGKGKEVFPWLQLFLLGIETASASSKSNDFCGPCIDSFFTAMRYLLDCPILKSPFTHLLSLSPFIPWESGKALTAFRYLPRTWDCSNENTPWEVHPPHFLIQKSFFYLELYFLTLFPDLTIQLCHSARILEVHYYKVSMILKCLVGRR